MERPLRQAIGRIEASRFGGALPEHYIRSLLDVASKPVVRDHIDNATLLRGACVEHYPFDGSLPQEFRRSAAFEDRYIYHLRDVIIGPRSGMCWLPSGWIIGESYGALFRLLNWGRAALSEYSLPGDTYLDGPAVVLSTNGYFHWLLEALPACLHALSVEPTAMIVLPRSRVPSYVTESLACLGLTNIYPTDRPVVARNLVLAGRHHYSGFVPPEDIEIVRRQFLSNAPRSATSGHQAIYVSRRSESRSPANEVTLEATLEGLGVKIVTPQRMPWRDQVAAFATASVITGVHGAGLANLVWASSPYVNEVFSVDHGLDCYGRLTTALGGRYTPHACTRTDHEWGAVPVDEVVAATQRDIVNAELARPHGKYCGKEGL